MLLTNNKIIQLKIMNVMKEPLFINIQKIYNIEVVREYKYN